MGIESKETACSRHESLPSGVQMIPVFLMAAIVCAGCTGSEKPQERAGPGRESAGEPSKPASPALEIKRMLSGIEPTSAILLRLEDGKSIVGSFVAVDDSTITIDQPGTVRVVDSRAVIEVSISVDASIGVSWERVYPSK